VFEGHGGLVGPDHDNPEVADHVAEVMTHWLDRGADGWRLDATYTIPPAFWREVLPRVRAAHPDAWVLGEMIHGDYAAYVAESGIDSVTQYELWKAIWSSIVDANFFELAWALERHAEFAAAFLPYTFVGNHDVTRLASTVTDTRHVTHALAVLFMVPGTPSVYAGDEQGFRGIKEERVGGDDAIRPAFPSSPAELAPDGWPLYREHQRLIGLRRRHPWLTHARVSSLHVENEHLVILAEPRADDDAAPDERLVLALNLGDAPFVVPVPVGTPLLRSGDAAYPDPSTVPGHTWAIYPTP
jgi:glycosidase